MIFHVWIVHRAIRRTLSTQGNNFGLGYLKQDYTHWRFRPQQSPPPLLPKTHIIFYFSLLQLLSLPSCIIKIEVLLIAFAGWIFGFFSLKDKYFTELCWFLPNINIGIQPQVYICPFPLQPPSQVGFLIFFFTHLGWREKTKQVCVQVKVLDV